MKNYKYHYTYLISNLNPLRHERYYIGVHSGDILSADDNYMGSSSFLKESINEAGIDNFEKIIIAEFSSRDEAELHENTLHIEHNAAKNPLFYNKKNGTVGFHVTNESIANTTATLNDPNWKETIGKERRRKIIETLNDPIWKETKGQDRNNKHRNTIRTPTWQAITGVAQSQNQKETKADTNWKETKGRVRNNKHKTTLNDPTWKETKGHVRRDKVKATLNDSIWKETKGKEQTRKMKEAKADPVWIAANTFVCPHCNRSIRTRGMFNKWHNDNCKLKE
jgi:hypothetical protein